MNTPDWLDKFQTKLHNNQVDLATSQPILLYDPSEYTQPVQYKDESIFSETSDIQSNAYHCIDPYKHISHEKSGGCLEQVLVQKYSSQEIVLENEIIDRLSASHSHSLPPYHVVILDAVSDFVDNYYWHVPSDDVSISCTGSLENQRYIGKYQLQCIIFVNDQGSYFMALPCIIAARALADVENVVVEAATLKQISTLLKRIPLARFTTYNSDYIFQVLPRPSRHSYDVSHAHCAYNFSLDTQSKANRIIKQYVNNPEVKDTEPYSTRALFWEFYRHFFGYLSHVIKVKIDHNGDFIFHMKDETPEWKAEFAKCKRMNVINDSLPNRYLWSIDLHNLLQVIVMKKFRTSHPASPQTIQSLTIEKPQTPKSLVSSKGINDMLLQFSTGSEHKFFLKGTYITSIYGTIHNNKLVNLIESGNLNDNEWVTKQTR